MSPSKVTARFEGDGKIVGLHVFGDDFDLVVHEVDGDEALLRALAGVEFAVRAELQSAGRLLDQLCFGAGPGDLEDARRLHVGVVEVAIGVGSRRVGEAEAFRHDLPVLALDEQSVEGHIAAEVAFQIHCRFGGILAPEPFQGFRKYAAAVLGGVAVALGVVEARVVTHVKQGGVHLLIGQGPVPELIVHVSAGILLVDAEGFALGLANDGGVGISAGEIREAADGGEDLAELVGTLPSHGEGGDAAASGRISSSRNRA
jgi:hypothetical protein